MAFWHEILSHLSIIGGQWRIINVTGVEGILGVGLGHGLVPSIVKRPGCLVLVLKSENEKNRADDMVKVAI